jgi:hypothetical protein
MKSGKVNGIAVAVAFGMFAGQAASGENLLVNPGFETGTFAGWTPSGNTSFEGVSTSFVTTPYDGSYSAFFGAVGSYNIISQTIATTPGDNYNISFALYDGGGPFSDAYVDWGGAQVWNLAPKGTFGWTLFGVDAVATGSATTVSFGFEQDPSFFNLDDTSVVDLTQHTSVVPVNNTSTLAPPIPDPVKGSDCPGDCPDQGVGLWASAATLLGLCAVAGYRSRRRSA